MKNIYPRAILQIIILLIIIPILFFVTYINLATFTISQVVQGENIVPNFVTNIVIETRSSYISDTQEIKHIDNKEEMREIVNWINSTKVKRTLKGNAEEKKQKIIRLYNNKNLIHSIVVQGDNKLYLKQLIRLDCINQTITTYKTYMFF